MGSIHPNPRLAKIHRSYSVEDLARLFKVHKNTVRHWQRDGLKPIDGGRPILFHGSTVRDFLAKRNASRKAPCLPGTLYCFRCRAPRDPAGGMVDFIRISATSGNLRALCATCETVMHRRAATATLAAIMPACDMQFAEGPARLKGSPRPSLNCDLERKASAP